MTPGRFNSIRQFLSFGHFRKFCKQQFGEDQRKNEFFLLSATCPFGPRCRRRGEQATCSLVPPRQKMRRADNNSFLSSWKNLEGGRPRLFFSKKRFLTKRDEHEKILCWPSTCLQLYGPCICVYAMFIGTPEDEKKKRFPYTRRISSDTLATSQHHSTSAPVNDLSLSTLLRV